MPKNLKDGKITYLDDKVTFLNWEHNGLILSKIWVRNVQWKILEWDSRGYHNSWIADGGWYT